VMQSAREVDPQGQGRDVGILTAGVAVGQLGGPLIAALSSHFSGGLQAALGVACAARVVAGLLMLPPVREQRRLGQLAAER